MMSFNIHCYQAVSLPSSKTPQKPQTQQLISADLTIDPTRRSVSRDGHPLPMTPLTFDCLFALLKAAPEVASSEALLEQLWPDRVVNDETLTQRIALLRKDLGGEDPQDYIQSVRSRGYRWRHPVEETESKPSQTAPAPKPIWQTGLIVIACLAGCVLLATWWKQIVADRHSARELVINPSPMNTDPYSQLIEQAGQYYQRYTEDGTRIAIDRYRQARNLDPKGIEAITGLSQSLSQSVTKFNAPHQWLIEATTLAETATTLAPENARSWWVLGFARDAQGQIQSAIEHYRKALKRDPENSSYAGSLAYLLTQSGQLVEAMQMNLAAYDGNTQYRSMQIAETFELLGWPVLAEQWYQRADQLHPDSVFAGLGRARFLLAQRRLDDASDVINRALDAGVSRPELHCLSGQIGLLENRQSNAAEQFATAILIDPLTPCGPVWQYWLSSQSDRPALSESLKDLLRDTIPDEDIWPAQYVHAAMIRMAQDRPTAALQLLEASVRAGFRQVDLLLQSVAFMPLWDEQDFIHLVQTIRKDVHLQRQQLMQSDWLPEDILQPIRRQAVFD